MVWNAANLEAKELTVEAWRRKEKRYAAQSKQGEGAAQPKQEGVAGIQRGGWRGASGEP